MKLSIMNVGTEKEIILSRSISKKMERLGL